MLSNRVARNTLGMLMLMGALLASAGPALAQVETAPAAIAPAVTLKAGDKAPSLAVEKWVKGDPVSGFERGKVYVVEFWATWCGPCIASMPHLSAVQKAYKDEGVTVIGTNIWEDKRGKEYDDKTLGAVEDFVRRQGDRMSYTVAYDGKAKATDSAYVKAAGQGGIPCAFLIDKTGTIAWIGHPMWLDIPLAAVVADKWDLKSGPEQITKAQEKLNEVEKRMATASKDVVDAWDAFEREYPAVARNLTDFKFNVMLAGGQFEQARKLGMQLVDEATANKDATALDSIAWMIVDPESQFKQRDLDLALKAATKADELTEHADPAILDTLARVYFLKGDIDKAIELETGAIERAKGSMRDQLQKALDEYKEAKDRK